MGLSVLKELLERPWRYQDMGKGDAPATPDYAGAAQATAQGNLEATRSATIANRINQYTPYGSLTYSQTPTKTFDADAYNKALDEWKAGAGSTYSGPSPLTLSQWKAQNGSGLSDAAANALYNNYTAGFNRDNPNYVKVAGSKPVESDYWTYNPDAGWSSTVNLSPDQQKLLDQQNQVSLGLAGLSNKGLDYVSDMLSDKFDTSALPAAAINGGQTAQDAIMSRLNPVWNQKQSALETQLANQGITRGSEAYTNAMRDYNSGRNDAEIQAALQGMTIQQQARQQALQEQAYLRNEPLNTLNAVRTGAQVQNPSFTSVPQQQTTAGPDLLGAAQASFNADLGSYNAQQAGSNALMGGLFSLGGAVLGAPPGSVFGKMFSDRRLKRNVVKIGKTNGGINIYSFEYIWGQPAVGVMADEVSHIDGAVLKHESGFDMVDYSKIW